MGEDDYYTVLQQEFAAEEGSFLCQLHYRVWDKAAFTRVTNAMLACCLAYDEDNQPPTLFGQAYDTTRLPRWLTERARRKPLGFSPGGEVGLSVA
jgi:hypothetical protein